nr:integrase, catalytic region, zinc finger, CCHC-type, peptidase aspartic, catalytic [Tanacetum cinerariifolium]
SQQAATRNRGKEIVNSPQPIYDQEPSMVADDDEMSKDNEIDKLMALISLSFKKIYKPTNNLRTSSKTSRANQDNSPRINRSTGCENQRIEDQELEAHYMYMAQIQEVSPDVADSGPIFDAEPLQKVSNDDHYNVFAIESKHPEQSTFVHDTYPIEQDEHNVIIDSLDMSYDREQIDQNDDDAELANEQKNALMYTDLKKFKAELDRSNDVEYASKMEIECAKAKGDLISYKVESQNSFNKYTQTINDLNQTISEMKKKLCAHQETISILSQAKEAHIKLYKTHEDKELDKVIALENKVKVLDNIVYKTGQSVQTVNMLNSKCRMSFAKPEFLKKAQRANPRLSDIGVIPTTSVSRPQLKSNPLEDRVMLNNSHGKKQEVEDHRRNVKFSKNKTSLVEIVLFIVDSGCSKHMTGNLKLLINFVEKFLGTVKFENDQIAPILGYGDLVQGAVMIKRVYYVEELNHNLFSVGQFWNADLEVAFRKSTCYIRDLKGNDLLTCSRGTDLYSITLQDTNSPNPICLMAKATSSQAWLWHRRLSHLNLDTINLLSKNDIVVGLLKLKFVKDNLCSSCTEFLNHSLHAYFASEGILHQTAVARTPEQNDVVKRRNPTLAEAARIMLSAAKVPLFFWAEAIATVCFTQNRSLVIPRHEKTPYHIINDRKMSVKFFYIFGSLCYIIRDGENLDKIKEKGDACIFVGYSTESRSYRVFNKRTRVLVETIHVNFDELPQMASDHVSSDPGPQCQRMELEHDSLSPGPQCQENVPQEDKTVTTSNELDLLFSPMFTELLNGSSQVVSKSSVVTTVDAHNQRQQQHITPLNNQTTPNPTCQVPTQAPIVTSTENINQAETVEEYAQVDNDEFINIFCTLVQDRGETSSRHVDSSNMHSINITLLNIVGQKIIR